ncbi:MAG: helix-turn-helix transcriptional regulator [Chloroflexi bacterium]|nr:helix-turn-helix transcriptional regulator [Chloroflexota bacterium]MBV9596502.1 helix-turn-helix transcriptional regulator [Chloroflexota bacterium]
MAARAWRARGVSGRGVNQAVLHEASDAVFAALADPTRRRVLRLVAERGPTSATLLEPELPVTRQAIVKHLAVLNRAGLISGQRSGQEVRYALVPGSLDEASEWIAQIGSRWDERLARLRQVVLEQNP